MGGRVPAPTPARVRRAFDNPRYLRAWLQKVVSTSAYVPYASVALSLLSRRPVGENVYDADWDLLIVLDTCRVDALREVAPEFSFLEGVGRKRSLGSKTSEWTIQTFRQAYADEVSRTAYVTSNPNPRRVLGEERLTPEEHESIPVALTSWSPVDSSAFSYFETVYDRVADGTYGHPDGPVPAEYLTDRAIAVGRDRDPDRTVVHYIQPHSPYTRRAFHEDRPLTEAEANPGLYLRQGHDRADVWDLYLLELRYVLGSVSDLLENFDAETAVITADHGEGFGEWGCYKHPAAVPHPTVRHVPWVEVTATDTGEYVPEYEPTAQPEDDELAEQLAALGYR